MVLRKKSKTSRYSMNFDFFFKMDYHTVRRILGLGGSHEFLHLFRHVVELMTKARQGRIIVFTVVSYPRR